MGIPLDVFSLYSLRDEDAGCGHHLLVRVGRPAFSNADEGEYAAALRAADAKRDALLEAYEAGALAAECAGRHTATLAGELQSRPVGDALSGERGGFYVELWVAETQFGSPWVVMGTADGEEEFWREVEEDEDLSGLRAYRPARRLRAYFLAGEGDETGGGV
ncbi:MAG TPA: hypothetical protein VF659_20640 [Pyrinomonadaceae bacterium]|jgi:hypothetical protein